VRRLADFDVDDVSECSDALRGLAGDAGTMEEAAAGIARYLYDELGDEQGGRALALARVYKTHPFGALPPDLQDFAGGVLGEQPAAEMRCLTLLGTAGDVAEWNDPRFSQGHRAIPLASEAMVAQLPMVVQLITQLGLEVSHVIRPDPRHVRELSQRTYDVFHVLDAPGNPHLPAQDFVEAHGIRSALGFGGMLYTGDFYAVVVFSKERITRDVAQLLKILSLAVRVPLLAHLRRVFAD
jgi:two-component system NtrC family sensor kinase